MCGGAMVLFMMDLVEIIISCRGGRDLVSSEP